MEEIQTAKRLFNETWDLMDKPDRSPEDDITMLHKAHTSCYLWRSAEKPVNNARGEWQVSRVYSVLGKGELALLHGEYSLEICLKNSIGGLDLAFGYEAVARAYSVLKDWQNAEKNKSLGLTVCDGVSDAEDREYAKNEILGIAVA